MPSSRRRTATLTDLDDGRAVVFRIKVVDESTSFGRILAASHAIRPFDERLADDQHRSILPVETKDLRETVWRLDMTDFDRPTLLISNRIPGFWTRSGPTRSCRAPSCRTRFA